MDHLTEHEVDIGYSPRRGPWTRGQWVSRADGAPLFWINAQWRTTGSRRKRLRRDPCGEGLGRSPDSLAEQLNHNQIWKRKMKTKLGKLVKCMRSLEGEAATVWGAVYVCMRVSYPTLYYRQHYHKKKSLQSHPISYTSCHVYNVTSHDRHADSFTSALFTPVLLPYVGMEPVFPSFWHFIHSIHN